MTIPTTHGRMSWLGRMGQLGRLSRMGRMVQLVGWANFIEKLMFALLNKESIRFPRKKNIGHL